LFIIVHTKKEAPLARCFFLLINTPI